MKLVRYGESGSEKPGVIDAEGTLRDLSAHVDDITGDVLSDAGLDRLRSIDPASLPVVEGTPRMGPCVGNIGKFMCIGLNYADHAEETGNPFPAHPVLFMKANSAIIGANDTVSMPRGSTSTDWELELGVVIGKKAKYVSEEEALDYVAGYGVHNDYSEREWQLEKGGQWVKGKSADSYAPFGPYMATRDEVADPNNLKLWLSLNGNKLQDGCTTDFIFNIQQVISYLSGFMTLLPGDVISTGTPAGVGLGFDPPVYLKEGDVVELGIDGLGTQSQTAVKEV